MKTHSLDLTTRYRMTLSQAAAVLIPCGCHAGKPMGEADAREVYWFASRITSANTKPAMRDAIVAARIIRSYRKDQRNNERWEADKARNHISLSDAKRAMVECISCGRTSLIPRKLLDRASTPKCFSCGGTLADLGGFVDEFITAASAASEYSITAYQLRKGAREGHVLHKREGGRRLFGRASIEKYLLDLAAVGHH